MMKLEDRKYHRLTYDPARDADPIYSPDGDWIVFDNNSTGNYDVYALDPDKREVRKIIDDPAYDCCARFSADGQWLIFQSDRNGTFDLYRIPWPYAQN
jgi:Tol biopolymer transport system component